MTDLLAFTYFVCGGLVAGRAFLWQIDRINEDPKIEKPADIPLTGLLLVTLLSWLAWPIVWGCMRAYKERS